MSFEDLKPLVLKSTLHTNYAKSNGNDCISNQINVCNAISNGDKIQLDSQKSRDDFTHNENDMLKNSIDLFKNSDFTTKYVKDLQRSDSELNTIIQYRDKSKLPKLQRKARRIMILSADYLLIDGLLLHSRNAKCKMTQRINNFQLELPKIMIHDVLKIYHESPMSGHRGIKHTVDIISEHFYFQKLPSIDTNFVKSCHVCQSRKIIKSAYQIRHYLF